MTRQTKTGILTLLLLALLVAPIGATVYYVDGTKSGDGSSWSTAENSVQAAIDAASSGDEVWVKAIAGCYNEHITMKAGVSIYGGFAGTETERSQRDWDTNVTRLDGTGLSNSVITAGAGITTATFIDGFTIQNGVGIQYTPYAYGGGLYCTSGGSPTISHNRIINNTATHGGGILASSSSSPVIEYNTIQGNEVTTCGGGISMYNGIVRHNTITLNVNSLYGGGAYISSYADQITISDNTITENQAASGAGISCGDTAAQISDNTISDNTATGTGGGVYCGGGTVTIDGNEISGNDANYSGGISCNGGSATISGNTVDGNGSVTYGGICTYQTTAVITGNTVSNNTATANVGGIACAYGGSPVVTGNSVTGNEAGTDSGGMKCWGNSATISNNLFQGNEATTSSGGLSCSNFGGEVSNNVIEGNTAGTYAGGVFLWGCSPTIANNLIAGNVASTNGAGLWWETELAGVQGSVTNNTIVGNTTVNAVHINGVTASVANNIIAFNSSGFHKGSTGTLTITYNDVYNPSGYDYSWTPAPSGNISTDPLFVGSGDYHLTGSSPCIDTGDDTKVTAGWLDIDGQLRIIPTGGTVDIGADEYPWTANIATDSNNDGNIDANDDPIEENSPGRYVRLNNDDDNNNGSEDKDDYGTVAQENDLVEVDLSFDPVSRMTGAQIVLEATTGPSKIHVWTASTKGTGITLPRTYTVGTDTIPEVVYVEGVETGEALLDMVVKSSAASGGVELHRDRVRFTVEEVAPKTLFVKKTGNDSCSGLSWSEAKLTVTGALSVVSSDGYQIWVAEGTYEEHITLPANDVQLYGGFPSNGGVWSSRSRANATILDAGNTGYRVVYAPNVVVESVTYSFKGVIDGFTITNGGGYAGGGVYCEGPCTISNNTITDNELACPASSPYDVYGAGIYCGGDAIIRNNTISLNHAAENAVLHGGGIYCETEVTPVIKNNFIIRNTATGGYGGGMYCAGGGAYTTCNAIIIGSTFAGNEAGEEGGGLYIEESAAGYYIYEVLVSSIIAFNSAPVGGGIGGLLGAAPIVAWSANDVYGNTEDDFGDWYGAFTMGDVDPAFVDETGGDYHLTVNSPCIDAGDDSDDSYVSDGDTDIDGEPRQFDYPYIGTTIMVDIGADEVSGPSTPIVTDDGDSTTLTDTLHASWQSVSPGSPISGYFYAIGTSRTAPTEIDWTAETGTQVTAVADPSLTAGQTYYFYVKAVNGLAESPVGVSDGITVITTNQVSPPVFTPRGGTYCGCTSVKLTCATPGATIVYLVDWTGEPSTVYDPDGSVVLGHPGWSDPYDLFEHVVRAKAYKDGMEDSPTVTETYHRESSCPSGSTATYDCWVYDPIPAPSVTGLRVTDIRLTDDPEHPTTRLEWGSPAGWSGVSGLSYVVSRTVGATTDPLSSGQAARLFDDDFDFTAATTLPYQYSVGLAGWTAPLPTPAPPQHCWENCVSNGRYPNCRVFHRRCWAPGGTKTIDVTPVVLPAEENQAVDGRKDTRCVTIEPVDFQFQGRKYRGGLFAGFMNLPDDHSDVGRSFLKFVFPSEGMGDGDRLWAGTLQAYYNKSAKNNTTTHVGCQPVADDSWSEAGSECIKWTTSPSIDPANPYGSVDVGPDNTRTPPYWCWWNDMFGPMVQEMYGDGTLSAALASTNEAVEGWPYFVKKEYNANLGPRLVYAYGSYEGGGAAVYPAAVRLSASTVSGLDYVTGTVTLNGPAPAGGCFVTLRVLCDSCQDGWCYAAVPSYITVPGGQMTATFTISTAEITSAYWHIDVVIQAGNPPASATADLAITQ